ncbi:hypothetical protein [Nonomuraea ceibae]|uniref:hypothetical protein n=1 Tax=Nonomuraea ceibae TaxID=1935170 RepID=UPI001C5EA83C|nr:hypothetical protein [Nonomuraea ceibae]
MGKKKREKSTETVVPAGQTESLGGRKISGTKDVRIKTDKKGNRTITTSGDLFISKG